MIDKTYKKVEPLGSLGISIERIVWLLNAVLRRSSLILGAMLVAALIAAAIVKFAPQAYVTKAIILTQPANQTRNVVAADLQRQTAIEQLRVLEAWLKSDHVFGSLLPELMDGAVAKDPRKRTTILNVLRASLEFELIGASVIEIRLRGSKADGLGKKLEVIIARLVEGLIQPDSGILTASQLIVIRGREALRAASEKLSAEISAAGLEDTPSLRSRLQQLDDLNRQYAELSRRAQLAKRGAAATSTGALPVVNVVLTRDLARIKQQIEKIRPELSERDNDLKRLEIANGNFLDAMSRYDTVRRNQPATSTNYLGVFTAPERLTIVGRPKDPVVGKSSGLKYAVALILLALLGTLGWIGILEILDNRLKMRQEFEAAAGVSVIARLPRVRP